MRRRRLIGAAVFAVLALVLFGFPGAFDATMFPWGTLLVALFLGLIGYLAWPAFEIRSRLGYGLEPNPSRVLFAIAAGAVTTLASWLFFLLLPYDPTVEGLIRGFVMVTLLMYLARPNGLDQASRET